MTQYANNEVVDYGYIGALEAAGATILAYEEFGDYQGTILCKIEYKGTVSWLEIWYGSCGICDTYLNWCDSNPNYTKEDLKEFAKRYLQEEDLIPQEEMLVICSNRALRENWDNTAEEMLKFVKENM